MRRTISRGFASTAPALQAQAPTHYNPVHSFDLGNDTAVDFPQFRKLISNPGPLRIVYSDDYLDWYYRAYMERKKFVDKQARAKKQFDGFLNQTTSDDAFSLPFKPRSSEQRQRGEALQAQSQARIEEAALQQGRFDLFNDRLQQFPQIHIDRCTDFHIKELVTKHLIEPEGGLGTNIVGSEWLWRKALIYRALLKTRMKLYPSSFKYILDTLDSIPLSKPSSSTDPTVIEKLNEAREAQSKAEPGAELPANLRNILEREEESATKLFPTYQTAEYYEFLVRKYHVENAVDAYVVLSLHMLENADKILYSNPPPKEDDSGRKYSLPREQPLPGLDALIADENMPTAKVLLFAEWNCQVSTDPFIKYPSAASALLRPIIGTNEAREAYDPDGRSLADKVGATRTALLPEPVMIQKQQIDTKMREMQRFLQAHAQNDEKWAKNPTSSPATHQDAAAPRMTAVGAMPAAFNPRAIRPELRHREMRKLISAIKSYDQGRKLACQPVPSSTHLSLSTNNNATLTSMTASAVATGEDGWRFKGHAAVDPHDPRSTVEGHGTSLPMDRVPLHRPSIPRYLRLVRGDKHINFILSVAPSRSLPTGDGSPALRREKLTLLHRRIMNLSLDLATAMYRTALEYHAPENRQVMIEAQRVAGALLDAAVTETLDLLEQHHRPLEREVKEGAKKQNLEQELAMHIAKFPTKDSYVPFATRQLDEFGFPTAAKMDDFKRWTTPRVEAFKFN